jgi:hypothetical protein
MALTSNDWIARDRGSVVSEFRDGCSVVLSSDDKAQLAYAIALAVHWKFFLAIHQSPSAFARLSRSEQIHFYECMQRLQLVRAREPFAALAAQMICHYLHAIIDENLVLQREASDFLNRYARMGWPNVLHVPIRRKRSIRSLLIDLLG